MQANHPSPITNDSQLQTRVRRRVDTLQISGDHDYMSSSDNQVFVNWSESAAFWDKHRDARRAMFRPIIPALCEDAGIPPHHVEHEYRVLDIAAGPGDVSLELSELLGPNATIWCTDFVPAMVNIAQRVASEKAAANVHCQQCAAEDLPFESNYYDAAVCRFGIMFFSDPQAALTETLRVLKPGCRFSHCVWGTREANPFHHAVQDVLDRYISGPPTDPDAPGAYRFAEPGKLAAVARKAGASDVRERVFRFPVAAPLSFDQFFESRTEMSDSLRDKLRRMPQELRGTFKEDVRRNTAAYFSGSSFNFPTEVLLVSGSK